MDKICPCKGCVPPKRHSTCHSTCPDYISWSAEQQAHREEIYQAKRRDFVSSPREVWRSRNMRRKNHGNN